MRVTLWHGNDVDVDACGWFEGAWNGDYRQRGFMDAQVLCGTAGKVEGDRAVFRASSDYICPLFSVPDTQRTWVSNSIVFVLATSGQDLDPIYPYYGYDLLRIWRRGFRSQDGRLRTRRGHHLCVFFGLTLTVERNGASCGTGPPGPEPRDYAHYIALLRETLGELFRNAAVPDRRLPLTPLSAIARGYDSTATAALAAQAGCRRALSFTDSRRPDPLEDCGEESARRLGMECAVYDRWAYLRRPDWPGAEFGVLPISSVAPLAVCEDTLAGSLYVTGNFGDFVWSQEIIALMDAFTQPFSMVLSGVGHLEFRLRVGYTQMTPIVIGARHNHALHRIMTTPDMDQWSTGNAYDRPLPRRIAEEAGLPRGSFGQVKLMTGHSQLNVPGSFTQTALDEYRRFVRHSHARVSPGRRACWRTHVALRHGAWKYLAPKSRRFVRDSRPQRLLPFILNVPPPVVSWDYMFTLQWACRSLAPRYRLTKEDI